MKKEKLYVDGYNMIGSWPDLVKLKNMDKMADARDYLLHELSNYSKYEGIEVVLVFDAQLVPGVQHRYDKFDVTVIFTSEGETADSYIERSVGEENLILTHVMVATSDLAEQWMIFQKGASRKSANELYKDIKRTKKNIAIDATVYRMNQYKRNSPFSDKYQDYFNSLIEDMSKPKAVKAVKEKPKKKK
ncbi:NYN domain-containing protein [Alkalibacterium sp. MB6]|uniref:NYN domain-containing protein n=1 Tax=Alkalibacterium sp. MB6 TaxID=2081965 RepID=UPI00137B714F|nr:NYN domain-containing protein [Alkalibacterium sp. MB6]